MACETLDGGITLGCDNNIGGVKKIRFAEKDSVTSFALSSPGSEINSFTMSGSPVAKFYEFEFNKNTSSYTEETTEDQASGRSLSVQTINLVLNRREKTKRDAIITLSRRKDLVCIVTDQNDINWYFGETNGVNLTTNTGGSGVAKTDANQYVLTFVGEEPNPANTVTTAAVTAVTA
jgi:hypothetical protein